MRPGASAARCRHRRAADIARRARCSSSTRHGSTSTCASRGSTRSWPRCPAPMRRRAAGCSSPSDPAAVGCIALRPLDASRRGGDATASVTGEVKRLYVRPGAPQRRLGPQARRGAARGSARHRLPRAEARHARMDDRGARALRAPRLRGVRAVLPQSAARRRVHGARAVSAATRDASERRRSRGHRRAACRASRRAPASQVVVAVIGKSDVYPRLPWKAFALGASLAALALVVGEAWRPDWATGTPRCVVAVTILGAGALSALAAVYVPAFARLFLRPSRARRSRCGSTRRRCSSSGELFRTRERTGVLLLVSLFERKIELVPDTGCRERVDGAPNGSASSRGWRRRCATGRPADALPRASTRSPSCSRAKAFARRAGRRSSAEPADRTSAAHERARDAMRCRGIVAASRSSLPRHGSRRRWRPTFPSSPAASSTTPRSCRRRRASA